MSANSCTGEVLKKLLRIELAPWDDDNAPLSTCFDHISELENLETLKCSVINPQAKYGFVSSLNVSINTKDVVFEWVRLPVEAHGSHWFVAKS